MSERRTLQLKTGSIQVMRASRETWPGPLLALLTQHTNQVRRENKMNTNNKQKRISANDAAPRYRRRARGSCSRLNDLSTCLKNSSGGSSAGTGVGNAKPP